MKTYNCCYYTKWYVSKNKLLYKNHKYLSNVFVIINKNIVKDSLPLCIY